MKKLILIGGGHSHAIALRLWKKSPLKEFKVILLSNVEKTFYSGMLPSYLAGFYHKEEMEIDLIKLIQGANIEFVLDQCVGIDPHTKQVFCQNHQPLDFDYLSLNIGSKPNLSLITGADQFGIGVKPIPEFLAKWHQLLTQIHRNSLNLSQENPLKLAIVGGGAGGVELSLNIKARLSQLLPQNYFQICLFHQGKKLLQNHNQFVSQRLKQLLLKEGIRLYLGETVTKIEANQIICQSNLTVDCQYPILVTQSRSPNWLKNSGLKTDQNGFILVNSYLQSVSHPFIFAAGDIATLENNPTPKAGVFAVRQGKPLFNNLHSIMKGQSLKAYFPQSNYLALISTGKKEAIAAWGNFGYQSSLLWLLKDYIDRQFMGQFPN